MTSINQIIYIYFQVVTVRGTNFEATAAEGGNGSSENIDVPSELPLDSSSYIKSELTKSDRPELASAKVKLKYRSFLF